MIRQRLTPRPTTNGERETVIMRKCIASLAMVGHISQIMDGGWLFKVLLAAKPHQEHVRCIADFVWRFCVNYIPLNSVTRLIACPIPRCDSAIHNEFGQGKWRWMFGAPMGYHQLAVAPASQEKLAFQGVDAIKWTYGHAIWAYQWAGDVHQLHSQHRQRLEGTCSIRGRGGWGGGSCTEK